MDPMRKKPHHRGGVAAGQQVAGALGAGRVLLIAVTASPLSGGAVELGAQHARGEAFRDGLQLLPRREQAVGDQLAHHR